MRTPGLGKSQQAILDALKRRGAATTPELAAALGRNVETVRDHLKVLVGPSPKFRHAKSRVYRHATD